MFPDFINKIAKMITDDPDIINESDEDLRRMQRARDSDPTDRAATLRHRNAAERRQLHGSVTADQLFNLYITHAGDPKMALEGHMILAVSGTGSSTFFDEWMSRRQELRATMADHLMEYAPNFERSMISRMIAIIEEMWRSEGMREVWEEWVNAAASGETVDLPYFNEAVTLEYLDHIRNTIIDLRERLNKILNITDEVLPEKSLKNVNSREELTDTRAATTRNSAAHQPWMRGHFETILGQLSDGTHPYARFMVDEERDRIVTAAREWWATTPDTDITLESIHEFLGSFK